MRIFVFGCLISSLVACTTNSEKPVCGNGRIEGAEQCDDGAANGTLGDACSSTCTTVAPFCGDGVVDTGEQCDDGPNNGAAGDHCSSTCTSLAYITANWSVDCVPGGTGCTPGCPVGYDTAAVYSQRLDSSGQPSGQPVVDLFNCADGTGKTAALSAGNYLEYIAITDHNNTMTFANSLSQDVDITAADKSFTEHIYIDGGYFHWSWTLKGATSNNALTCADVPNQNGAEIITTVTASTTAFSDIFTCTDGEGTTAVLSAVDTYTCAFDIIDNENPPKSLGNGIPLSNQVIMDTNRVTELGTQTIYITGQ